MPRAGLGGSPSPSPLSELPCFHLRVSVGPWRSTEADRLDEALVASGSRAIDLPWEAFELCEDGLHFSPAGGSVFARALCEAMAAAWGERRSPPRRLLVLSDSTIGHHDYDDEGTWTGGASEELARMLADEVDGLEHVHIDAVCGSGFVACAREGRHYRARLARRKREVGEVGEEACLLIGGWNDLDDRHSAARVCAAAQACVALARRSFALTEGRGQGVARPPSR